MSNSNFSVVDLSGIILGDALFSDDTVNFSGAATYKKGSIMARSTASGKLIPYVKGGNSDGNGVPVAVLNEEMTSGAAGDLVARVISEGKFRLQGLVVHADGDSSNIDKPVVDLLRTHKITAISSEDVSELDNH